MKKSIIITVFLALGVLFFFLIKPNPARKKTEFLPLSEPKLKAELEGITKKDIQLKKAKVILESQDWIISFSPLSASGQDQGNDVLTFSEGRVISKNLFAKGYPQVRYLLDFRQEGKVSWEAVAESESGALASWKGELRGEQDMRGILSLQAKNGELEDFFFKAVNSSSEERYNMPENNNSAGKRPEKKRRQR